MTRTARAAQAQGTKPIAHNRRARYDYHIEESVEAGIALTGTEVKACREGRVNLADAYAAVRDGEAWLLQCYIGPYAHGNRQNHEPMRPRKLLLHKAEIEKLDQAAARGGRTLVPLRMYFKGGLAKAEIAISVGKKRYDKRQATAEREAERRMRRELGRRR